MNYDPSEQRLDINVPRAWVMKNYQNYVDPSLWENGINAATLSYNINAYRSENSNYTNDSVYTSFNGGVNLGPGVCVAAVTIAGETTREAMLSL